jgi:hypothetical protein
MTTNPTGNMDILGTGSSRRLVILAASAGAGRPCRATDTVPAPSWPGALVVRR